MSADAKGRALREVNLTTARNLSPLFDEAVRKEHPVIIVRGGRERGVLLAQDAMLRVLAPYEFHVDVIPEDNGGFTLWLRELEIGGTGESLSEARRDLLAATRSYVSNYLQQFDFYRHIPELARLEPFVLRLALTRHDKDLVDTLFTRERATGLTPAPRAIPRP